MNWLCATLIACLSFNSEMDYTNNKEFIEDVTACALHLNSMEDEWNRIPVDLVVAQAIHESEWGRSRFAVEGNNLMGIKEFDEARDGLKPRDNSNVKWSIKIFDTKCQSLIFYMNLLNDNHNYEEFRLEQLKQWTADYVDLEKLAGTLAIYAEDVYYTQKIIKIIRKLKNYE